MENIGQIVIEILGKFVRVLVDTAVNPGDAHSQIVVQVHRSNACKHQRKKEKMDDTDNRLMVF